MPFFAPSAPSSPATRIKSENWDGVTAPAIPAGWTVDSQLQTSTSSSPTSSPNSLVYAPASANAAIVPHATWSTPDTSSGNVQVSATVRFADNAGSGGEQQVWVFARAQSIVLNATGTNSAYYAAGIGRNPSGSQGLFLQRVRNGTTTWLGSTGASAFADALTYRITLRAHGSALAATCQRLSDGFWLSSSGAFVSDPQNSTVALAATDSSLPAVSGGYAGAAFYFSTTAGGAVGLDDWLLESTGASSLGFTPAHVFNPADFGGDTFAGIRAAIAACAAGGGGIVQLGDTTYHHDGTPLILQQGVTLRGTHRPDWLPAGRTPGTQIEATGRTVPSVWLIDPTGQTTLPTSCYIEGVLFTGGTDVLSSNGSSGVGLRDLSILSYNGSGIRLRGQQEMWLVDNVSMGSAAASADTPIPYGLRHDEDGVGDAQGAPSLQKSAFRNMHISNVGIGIKLDTPAGGLVTFENIRIDFCQQGAIVIYGEYTDLLFSGLYTEATLQGSQYATGSISTGSSALTVSTTTGFVVGDMVTVLGAGVGGLDLVTTVSAISGTTMTLAGPAQTTVSGVTVVSGTAREVTLWATSLPQAPGSCPARLTFLNCDCGNSGLYCIDASALSANNLVLINVHNTNPIYDPNYAAVVLGGGTFLQQPASFSTGLSGYSGTLRFPGPLHLGPAGSTFNNSYLLDVQGTGAGIRAGDTLLAGTGDGVYDTSDTARFLKFDGPVGQRTQIGSVDGIGFLVNPSSSLAVKDSFTLSGGETAGENLTAHSGETGAAWTKEATDATHGDLLVSAAGRAYLGGSTSSYWFVDYTASGAPAHADYSVRADLSLQSIPTVATDWNISLEGRHTNTQNYYAFGYSSISGWSLGKEVAGAGTSLGTAAATLSAGATHTIALLMDGDQISGQVDGVTVIGPVTDASLSAAGKAGCQFWVDSGAGFTPAPSAGPQLDNFLVTSIPAPGLAIDSAAHLLATGTAPSVVAGSGAGTSAPTPTVSGNDVRGMVSWGTGTGAGAGAQATVTFATAYASAPIVTLSPANDATTQIGVCVTSVSTTGFTLSAHAPAAAQAAGTYSVVFQAIG